jgi:hypothetical protein
MQGDKTMIAQRIQAKKRYEEALKAVRIAEKNENLQEWEAADAFLTVARRELVSAEMAHPTNREKKKENELLWLRNRGLDV